MDFYALDTGFSEGIVREYNERWSTSVLRDAVLGGRQVLLCAKDGEKIAGLTLGGVPEAGVATIVWLLVGGDYRGKGVGSDLFSVACGRYRSLGCHKIKLTTNSERAIKFYQKMGMAIEGVHPDHWWRINFWSLGMLL